MSTTAAVAGCFLQTANKLRVEIGMLWQLIKQSILHQPSMSASYQVYVTTCICADEMWWLCHKYFTWQPYAPHARIDETQKHVSNPSRKHVAQMYDTMIMLCIMLATKWWSATVLSLSHSIMISALVVGSVRTEASWSAYNIARAH